MIDTLVSCYFVRVETCEVSNFPLFHYACYVLGLDTDHEMKAYFILLFHFFLFYYIRCTNKSSVQVLIEKVKEKRYQNLNVSFID